MKILRYAAVSAIALGAGPAVAATLKPTALFEATGQLSLSSAGLQTTGNLVAEYNAPPAGSRPYIFSTSLSFGTLSVTPDITITTPEIVIRAATPPTTTCLPFVGCVTIPGLPAITLPSQTLNVTPTIPLASLGTVYDVSYRSPDLPLGDIFAFDYGTPLFGAPLSFGELVQGQFETGATTVSVAGGIGPFGATLDYEGVLQPGGNVILGEYAASLTEPGILGTFETFVLDLINQNVDQFSTLAFDLFLGTNPCGGFGALVGVCNGLLDDLDPNAFGIAVNSIGTLSADYTLSKSIAPIPLPAGGLLLLTALGGLVVARRRKAA